MGYPQYLFERNILGLIISFIGAVVIACSVFENIEDAHQNAKFFSWKFKLPLAVINKYTFWGGFIIFCLGFLIQILEKLN